MPGAVLRVTQKGRSVKRLSPSFVPSRSMPMTEPREERGSVFTAL